MVRSSPGSRNTTYSCQFFITYLHFSRAVRFTAVVPLFVKLLISLSSLILCFPVPVVFLHVSCNVSRFCVIIIILCLYHVKHFCCIFPTKIVFCELSTISAYANCMKYLIATFHVMNYNESEIYVNDIFPFMNGCRKRTVFRKQEENPFLLTVKSDRPEKKGRPQYEQ